MGILTPVKTELTRLRPGPIHRSPAPHLSKREERSLGILRKGAEIGNMPAE